MTDRAHTDLLLCVNPIAAMRQGRLSRVPDPVAVAEAALAAGADGIVAHLHADRRDVQADDLERLMQGRRDAVCAVTAYPGPEFELAESLRVACWFLAPSLRHEYTTEGGFDIVRWRERAREACGRSKAAGIAAAVVVDPDIASIDAAAECGFDALRLNTGTLTMASSDAAIAKQLDRLERAGAHARQIGLAVHAGRGLNYVSSAAIATIAAIGAVHVGHAVVARAVTEGISVAVQQMLNVLERPGDECYSG